MRIRISYALIALGLGNLLATASSAVAQTPSTEPAATPPATSSAAASGKATPAADGGVPKVAKKSKKSKAKTEPTAAADPPVPPGTSAAAQTGTPATAKSKDATASSKPAAASSKRATANSATQATGGTPKPTGAAPIAAKSTGPKCSLEDPEQPRGGRLDVIGTNFGPSPLVRVAGKPVRMIERREDRISVQVPADSDGGPVALQAQGILQPCGTLVIIGKNR